MDSEASGLYICTGDLFVPNRAGKRRYEFSGCSVGERVCLVLVRMAGSVDGQRPGGKQTSARRAKELEGNSPRDPERAGGIRAFCGRLGPQVRESKRDERLCLTA